MAFCNILDNITISDDIRQVVIDIMIKFNKGIILQHSLDVCEESVKLAERFSCDIEKARLAGLLHDIGGVYPNNERIELATKFNLEILEEERELPLIIHQKLSRSISNQILNINDEEILSAIECHTTLKSNPSKLDMIVFIADKLKWDQEGDPPYKKEVSRALEVSLEKGVFTFMDYQIRNNNLKVIHPWFEEGYTWLKDRVKNEDD